MVFAIDVVDDKGTQANGNWSFAVKFTYFKFQKKIHYAKPIKICFLSCFGTNENVLIKLLPTARPGKKTDVCSLKTRIINCSVLL